VQADRKARLASVVFHFFFFTAMLQFAGGCAAALLILGRNAGRVAYVLMATVSLVTLLSGMLLARAYAQQRAQR